ncbi:hypothetical protein CLOM_g13577 [Closterium sp. NIES-68]|nr:hypothetical protein CLOM_g13577 [Closterium sp. NIES-68]
MLRAFGCMVVFHVPKEKRGKLEASGRWGLKWSSNSNMSLHLEFHSRLSDLGGMCALLYEDSKFMSLRYNCGGY